LVLWKMSFRSCLGLVFCQTSLPADETELTVVDYLGYS
jgi:hypothetical protein